MDKIDKRLARIPTAQRKKLLATAKQIQSGKVEGLNLKSLSGSKRTFRARVGRYRIIFQIQPGKKPVILDIAKRDDRTY